MLEWSVSAPRVQAAIGLQEYLLDDVRDFLLAAGIATGDSEEAGLVADNKFLKTTGIATAYGGNDICIARFL